MLECWILLQSNGLPEAEANAALGSAESGPGLDGWAWLALPAPAPLVPDRCVSMPSSTSGSWLLAET